MEQSRFRQLVWLATAASVLLLGIAGWSHLRLRATRLEIDALASETSELATMNSRLRNEVDTRAAVRQSLRTDGTAVQLVSVAANDGAKATVHIDSAHGQALLVVENLHVDESCAYQLRIVPGDSPPRLVIFGVDPEGNSELLLEDLPARIREFRIERGESGEALLSGTI